MTETDDKRKKNARLAKAGLINSGRGNFFPFFQASAFPDLSHVQISVAHTTPQAALPPAAGAV